MAQATAQRKEGLPQGRGFCLLLGTRGQRVEIDPSYLPGYSWVQIAFELLNVRVGRILHLEPFLQEAQKQSKNIACMKA